MVEGFAHRWASKNPGQCLLVGRPPPVSCWPARAQSLAAAHVLLPVCAFPCSCPHAAAGAQTVLLLLMCCCRYAHSPHFACGLLPVCTVPCCVHVLLKMCTMACCYPCAAAHWRSPVRLPVCSCHSVCAVAGNSARLLHPAGSLAAARVWGPLLLLPVGFCQTAEPPPAALVLLAVCTGPCCCAYAAASVHRPAAPALWCCWCGESLAGRQLPRREYYTRCTRGVCIGVIS